jgi:hypothetical protein
MRKLEPILWIVASVVVLGALAVTAYQSTLIP